MQRNLYWIWKIFIGYEAIAQWKTATVLQQLHYRWKVGDSTDERMATIADAVPDFIQKSEELLSV